MITNWEARRQIVSIGKQLYSQGLAVAKDGNISIRLKADKIIITPSNRSLATLSDSHMAQVDLNGNVHDTNLKPSSELPLHLEVYRQRPDVFAVIHAHPPYATAFTLVGEDFSQPVLPDIFILFGEIPVAPYAAPGTKENALTIRQLIKDNDIIVQDHNGALTVGKSLKDAYCRMEKLEHAAKTLFIARQSGKLKPLSQADLKKLTEVRKTYLNASD